MMITTARTDWINHRVEAMMLDGDTVVELFEAVQESGGLPHQAVCKALSNAMTASTRAESDQCMDSVRQVLQAFAFSRACNEYDRRAAA